MRLVLSRFSAAQPYQKTPIGTADITHIMDLRGHSGTTASPAFFCSLSLTVANTTRDMAMPMPTPRWERPDTPAEKWYGCSNTAENVVKRM